ncbi:MAG TPA: PadR family transcriptional regulator [Mycobacteriales bacterium]|nr:PadR family transcriptional regulator [Mycobacteriales bacterium]
MSTTLNSTSAALLGLLHERPMTGGELIAEAQQRFGAFWSLTRSQVYRELPTLADAGYVKPGRVGPRASQPYAVTPAGKRAFAGWLSEPAGTDHPRSPVLLRLSFGIRHNKTQLRRLLEDARTEHEAKLAAHRAIASRSKKDGDTFAAATADFGVAYERAFLKLLDNLSSQ